MNICLYHGIDLDGFCSGAIYAKAMRERWKSDFELIPANYGWDLPWEKFDGAHVTLIDFSLQPWSEFERLFSIAASVTWIDHHKSAIDELTKVIPDSQPHGLTSVLDTTRAACELAWDHYFAPDLMPVAVEFLGRYDVWDHSDDRVLPFQYGMRNYDLRPDVGEDRAMWDDLLAVRYPPLVDRVRAEGKTILKYQTREDEIGARASCFTLEWEGLKWIGANRGGRGSKFFDSVYDPERHDGMMSFAWNGEVFTFGLYSTKPEIDCGAIAKRNGGGGHPGAAGFRCDNLPFELGQTAKLITAESR